LKISNKSLIVAGILGTVGVTALTGVGIASAESGTSNTADPMSSLVQKIASKFNLNKDDVQKLFDEDRTAHQAEREQHIATRLQGFVDDGTITAAQKTAIENKLKELKAERESDKETLKDLTDTQRKAKMDEKKTELESWAKEQGLDLSKLKGIFGGPGGHGGPRPTDNTN
jgi:chromosome segregation ATPase